MQDIQVEAFKKRLSRHTDHELDLIVNENRSTMLNLLEKKRKRARLSIHKMFLDAPEEVVVALADFIERGKKGVTEPNLIRGYIQSNLPRFDYSPILNRRKISTLGRVYNLATIYESINECYFEGKVNLTITWFGNGIRKRRSRIVFGEYFDHLKLIKINRILDDTFFPDYFVQFIVYHEMLHHVIPGFVEPSGRFRCHGHDFKSKEVLFKDYERAIAWERANKCAIFRVRNGRP